MQQIMMMRIETEDYSVWYSLEDNTLYFRGSLRLNGIQEYVPVIQLLNQVVEQGKTAIIINLCQLEFLNSSGISVLSKFVIRVRQKNNMQMVVQGSKAIPWQGKSLKNLQKLMPRLQLEWEAN